MPGLPGRVDAIKHCFDAELLIIAAAFIVRLCQPLATRCYKILHLGIRHQVAGDLLDSEVVERHVAIESVNHPIAIFPNVSPTINSEAARICVTNLIKPNAGPAFAELWRCEQAIDDRPVGGLAALLNVV